MDIQEKIRQWISLKLSERGHGSRGELASHLGVRPDVVTRMLNSQPGKETRVIRAQELIKISEFFGETPPGLDVSNSNDDNFIEIYRHSDSETKIALQSYLKFLLDTKSKE